MEVDTAVIIDNTVIIAIEVGITVDFSNTKPEQGPLEDMAIIEFTIIDSIASLITMDTTIVVLLALISIAAAIMSKLKPAFILNSNSNNRHSSLNSNLTISTIITL
jgi:hypothetical protein